MKLPRNPTQPPRPPTPPRRRRQGAAYATAVAAAKNVAKTNAPLPATPPPQDLQPKEEMACTNCGETIPQDTADYVMVGGNRSSIRCGSCNRTLSKFTYHKLGTATFTGLGEDERHSFFQSCRGKSSGQLIQYAKETKERLQSAIVDRGTSNNFGKPFKDNNVFASAQRSTFFSIAIEKTFYL